MKWFLTLVAAAFAAAALAGAAHAGCWATVGLSSTPKAGLAAGEPWVVTIRVLQHGTTPMRGARPEIRIREAGEKAIVFRAQPTARVGSYRARVVFPQGGRYSIVIYDGFPIKECAKTQTIKAVEIAEL